MNANFTSPVKLWLAHTTFRTVKTAVLCAILFFVTFFNAKADCSMTTLGGAGTYTIAQLVANGTLNNCTGKLTIPSGYTLALTTNAIFPSGISQIDVMTGGSINVNINYTFPSTLLKINLFDSDFVPFIPPSTPAVPGPLASGRINVDNANSTLTLANNTQLIIQNIVTQVGYNTGGAITVQATNGNCGQSVLIYLGTTPYAGCNNAQGGGVCFSFNDVIFSGGTPQINPVITINGINSSGNGVACAGVPFTMNATLASNSNYVPTNYTWVLLCHLSKWLFF